jgi:hypothetical protein
MDIAVLKFGKVVMVTYALEGISSLPITLAPASYVVEFVGGWEVSFGAQQSPSNEELTQHMVDHTAPWEPIVRMYGKAWNIHLSPTQWRAEAQGEIVLKALMDFTEEKNPKEASSHIPWVAALPRTFIEASRPKEVKALLKFGRDSNGPLKVTLSCALDEINSLSVTYEISWEGISWEDSKIGTEWFLAQFFRKAQGDGLGALPVWTQEGLSWLAILRKENNSIRVILHERNTGGINILCAKRGDQDEMRVQCCGRTLCASAARGRREVHRALVHEGMSPDWGVKWRSDPIIAQIYP